MSTTTIYLFLTVAGVLFSGYLSAKKLFTHMCAFNEPCQEFLGHPACWYGFGMFFIMLCLSLLGYGSVIGEDMLIRWNTFVSFIGLLFAGQFVVPELYAIVKRTNTTKYMLGLSTCAYGFFFFLIILVFSLLRLK